MITIRDWCLWWWRRDSNTACLVLIDLAKTMTTKDLRQMRDYLDSLATLKDMK